MTMLGTRTEPCLCGGSLRARNVEREVLAAVVMHQETARHTVWSLRTYGPPWRGPQPTFVPPPDPSLPDDLSRLALRTVVGSSAAGRSRT